MSTSGLLLIAGGGIIALMSLLHAVYTYADIARPRYLVPSEPALREAMMRGGLRLSRDATTMWKAWVGFNFSHSLGVAMLGAACLFLGLDLQALAPPRAVLLLPPALGLLYFWLALRYWFSAPAIGVGIATLCLASAWLLY
jgi:hypothetical protein